MRRSRLFLPGSAHPTPAPFFKSSSRSGYPCPRSTTASQACAAEYAHYSHQRSGTRSRSGVRADAPTFSQRVWPALTQLASRPPAVSPADASLSCSAADLPALPCAGVRHGVAHPWRKGRGLISECSLHILDRDPREGAYLSMAREPRRSGEGADARRAAQGVVDNEQDVQRRRCPSAGQPRGTGRIFPHSSLSPPHWVLTQPRRLRLD
jgi:hypothetical protein